ncbi:hypothetical protein [Haliscomenobacter sp.]|uniref:hypothetical protein n=1 Tax=Haliscomenobacter sp. TaxID=2717303 RepID=UPI0033652B84
MVQRIVKLKGQAYTTGSAVVVRVSYNGAEVFNTSVTASTVIEIPSAPALTEPVVELAVFETTTDITGPIPVTISVTGGTLFFAHFWMNYSGYASEQQATDPNVPIDPADPSTYTWVVTVQPDSYYGDPNVNTVESDGVLNLTKNGLPWVWRENVGNQLGDWKYPVAADETMAFDFFVDPAKVILVVPT